MDLWMGRPVLMIFFGVERNLKAEQQEIANRVSK